MFEEFGAATQTARQQVCGEIKILSHACTKFSRTFQWVKGGKNFLEMLVSPFFFLKKEENSSILENDVEEDVATL